MIRRDILKAAMALPIVAALPAMVIARTPWLKMVPETIRGVKPTATYRYCSMVKVAPLKWAVINDAKGFSRNEIIDQMLAVHA